MAGPTNAAVTPRRPADAPQPAEASEPTEAGQARSSRAGGNAPRRGRLPSLGARLRCRRARRAAVGWLLAATAALLTACDPVQPRPAASPPGEPGAAAPQEAAAPGAAAAMNAAPAALDGASLAAADLERGEVLSLACQACHPLDAGADAIIGPNLNGVFGRRAAAVPDFAYSDALRQADLVWRPEVLDRWLASPADFLPGNNMAFAGYRSPADRRDLIAFLIEATRPPQGTE